MVSNKVVLPLEVKQAKFTLISALSRFFFLIGVCIVFTFFEQFVSHFLWTFPTSLAFKKQYIVFSCFSYLKMHLAMHLLLLQKKHFHSIYSSGDRVLAALGWKTCHERYISFFFSFTGLLFLLAYHTLPDSLLNSRLPALILIR